MKIKVAELEESEGGSVAWIMRGGFLDEGILRSL
jgi:hypothetical protein